MGGIIGVTGTPGGGKKTVSPLAAKMLGLRCLGVNDLALSHGLLAPGDEVDTRKMRALLSREVPGPALVYGHLLPYVVRPSLADRVAVLRCEPRVLKRRLAARGYLPRKVAENVEAELIGIVSADSYDAFGDAKTFEVDTTRLGPSEAAREVEEVVRGATPRPRIDWTRGYDSGEKLRSLLSEGA